ncbi:MAG: chromosome segregation protein SMC, partial [Shimia sp.]
AEETIARLDWEAREIAEASQGQDAAMEEAREAASTSTAILAEREAELTAHTEEAARLSARHQSADRFLADTRRTLAAQADRATAARRAVTEAEAKGARAETAFAEARTRAAEAEAEVATAEEAATRAEAARAALVDDEAAARAAASEAEGTAGALRAEAQALSRLVERDTGADGQLLDHVEVAPGYEAALGAALADDLRAPLADRTGSGWAPLTDYPDPQPLPGGVAPLSDHVRVPSVLRRRIAQIGLVATAEGARRQADLAPGQRLVSEAGDLWRWDGYRAAAADAPSATALRLQQLNRLKELRAELDDAEARATETRGAHADLAARLKDAAAADQAARAARRAADQAQAEAGRALSRAEAERNLSQGKVEALSLAVARHDEDHAATRAQLTEAEAALRDLPPLDAARGAVEALKLAVEAARVTMMTHRAAEGELRRAAEARTKRGQQVTKELSGWRHRLESASSRTADLAHRRTAAEAELETARGAPAAVAAKQEALSDELRGAETRRAAAADALAAGELRQRAAVAAEREAERAASEAREARARAEARRDATAEGVDTAAERIAEEQETTPADLLARLDMDPAQMPGADRTEADVVRLRRQRDALGAVNLRAEEDAAEVQGEFDQLSAEKTDLEGAIGTLRTGIASLNKEGRERLLAAFDEVNESFGTLFTHLFGGGEARLELIESDDPLDAGLEILCQPPGKKLSTLSLLSGGEQTLTALALIFAVFLSNPAPICVLDEVDAPLDDANVTRFCDMLDEMTRRTDTRFLIITHHAVTMARMDRLFGVTMQEQGVSQLVSVDLKKAEALVA